VASPARDQTRQGQTLGVAHWVLLFPQPVNQLTSSLCLRGAQARLTPFSPQLNQAVLPSLSLERSRSQSSTGSEMWHWTPEAGKAHVMEGGKGHIWTAPCRTEAGRVDPRGLDGGVWALSRLTSHGQQAETSRVHGWRLIKLYRQRQVEGRLWPEVSRSPLLWAERSGGRQGGAVTRGREGR
jgi:hypothetical protein